MPGKHSRRGFIGVSALAATHCSGALGGSDEDGLSLSMAGYPYERVVALSKGEVKIPGCRVEFETDRIGPLNQHVFSGPQTRDVSEVGLIPFLLAYCNDEFRDYILLPVFVLKVFRHKSIFVHADSGIRKPQDLRGRKVATVGYSSSGLTWIRGVLQDEYDVSPSDIDWVVTAKDSAAAQTGGASSWESLIPSGLSITPAPDGADESSLLLERKVDAIFHPAEPKAYVDRNPAVKRLFEDPRAVEQAYYKKTGVFPIMHAVAIRRATAEAHPWLAKRIFEAYVQSKKKDYEEMRRIRWAYSSLPWFGQEFKTTSELMGDNFYSYGLQQNHRAVDTALRYLFEQGLATRRMQPEELFEQSTVTLVDE